MPTRPRPSATAAFTNAAHEYYLEQHATSEVGHRLNVSCQLCVLRSFRFTVEHRYYCKSPTTGISSLAVCDYWNTAEWVDDEVNEGLLICFILVMRFSRALFPSPSLSGGEIAQNIAWSASVALLIRFGNRFLVRLLVRRFFHRAHDTIARLEIWQFGRDRPSELRFAIDCHGRSFSVIFSTDVNESCSSWTCWFSYTAGSRYEVAFIVGCKAKSAALRWIFSVWYALWAARAPHHHTPPARACRLYPGWL